LAAQEAGWGRNIKIEWKALDPIYGYGGRGAIGTWTRRDLSDRLARPEAPPGSSEKAFERLSEPVDL